MQLVLAKALEDLAEAEVTGTSGGGMVTVTVTGQGEFTGIKIKPESVDPDDPTMLEDLVLAAINDAARAQQEMTEERMSGLGAGMNIPGMQMPSF